MPRFQWDQAGARLYSTGVDRGVLYYDDVKSAVWNGLTSVEETPSREHTSFYLDAVKYLDVITPGDYSGRLKAFTYPEEFEQLCGVGRLDEGIFVHDQQAKSFGLSYRTLLGNDIEGTDHGYRIHVLFNLKAIPDQVVYSSIGESTKPSEFSWALVGKPEPIPGHKPSCHLSFDSRLVPPEQLEIVENTLWGDDSADGSLPSMAYFLELIGVT